MRIILLCLTVLTIYVAKTAAAASAYYSRDPEHPGKCVVKNPDLIMSPGETYTKLNYCGIIKCGQKGLVEKYSCGVIAVREGCKLKQPLDKQAIYPDCCPQGTICNDLPNEKVLNK